MEDKRCRDCRWYTSCYNSAERYNEEVHDEEITEVCDDYKED